jgi:monovalent cation:H+ antiporter-2, CPA2 family
MAVRVVHEYLSSMGEGAAVPAQYPRSTKECLMATTCLHLSYIRPVIPRASGCEECLAAGRRDWVHLRLCQSCGHVGCCDSSPGRHARFHFHTIGHPIVRSLEPGEDWLWCYADEVFIELEAPPAVGYW